MKNIPILLFVSLLSLLSACADKEGDGFVDTAEDTEAEVVDADLDGFDAADAGGTDCDDDNADINPSKFDVVDDGVDNDCDGEVDNFQYHVNVRTNEDGDFRYFEHYTNNAPEGMQFYAMLFVSVSEHANWEEDPTGKYTVREGGFLANGVVVVDGDWKTVDEATDRSPPFFYDYPGFADDHDQLSFILCSSDGAPMMATGANCVVWGANDLTAYNNAKNIVSKGGYATFQDYKNADPYGAPREQEYNQEKLWAPGDMTNFRFGFFAIPPVNEN